MLLAPRVFKNFRQVLNITYLSKNIEHVMVVRFNQHLTKNGLHEDAYKQNHNTETVLLKVQNALLMAVNTYGGAVLIQHDLSAAFDTIDHTILLQWLPKLEMRCCIRLVQILFELADTIRCYQWPTIITSKYVLWSASGISTWSNIIHPVHNIAGRNSTEISAKFLYLCW